MRLLVDATQASNGGLAAVATGLSRGWTEQFPEDELLVTIGKSSRLDPTDLPATVEVRTHEVSRLGKSGRLVELNTALNRLTVSWRADALLGLLPQLPLRPAVPSVSFVHDLWHEFRPGDFSLSRRIQRALLYGRAYRTADRLVTISDRTHRDLIHLHPEARGKTSTVLLGADHVDGWAPLPTGPHDGPAIAFGHHANKRPDLALAAWVQLRRRGVDVPPLLITGLDEPTQDVLTAKSEGAVSRGEVRLHHYMDARDFQHDFQTARLLLFTSVFEGFGLPVVEAMRSHVPVVICPEPALLEVAGGHATVAADWTPAAVADAAARALRSSPEALEAAAAHARSFTWRSTAASVRVAVERAIAGPAPGG